MEEWHFISIWLMSLECEKGKWRTRKQRKISLTVNVRSLTSALELLEKKQMFQTDSCNQNGCIEEIFMLRFCKYKSEKVGFMVSFWDTKLRSLFYNEVSVQWAFWLT